MATPSPAVSRPQAQDQWEQPSVLSSPSLHLEDHITQEWFSSIMDNFSHLHCSTRTGNKGVLEKTKMTTADFQEAMSDLLGRPSDDQKIILLCKKIDADGLGFIDADEFCSYLLQQLKEKDSLSQMFSLPFSEPPKYRTIMCSKETICRLSLAHNPTRFISISKDGLMATWNTQLHFQRGMMLEETTTASGSGGGGGGCVGGVGGGSGKTNKSTAVWITDFVVMANCNKIVMSSSSRELVFSDVSTQSPKCQYKVQDLPCVPLCMNYHCDPESPGSKCHLLYGDVSGSVAVFTFHTPQTALFAGTESDRRPILVGFGGLSSGCQSQHVSLQYVSHLHSDWVRHVLYVPHNHTFISCSSAPTNSLIIRDIDHKMNNYTFRNRKGVSCFDFSHPLDLLVTGSLDHLVSFWNPYVPSKAVAVLSGHNTTILSVLIAKENRLVFSLSQDLFLCAWDLYEYVLIQTTTLKFPFTQSLIDFGPKPLALSPAGQFLIIACNEQIAKIKLCTMSGSQSDGIMFMTHKHPLCAAIYNKLFRQIVSGCEGGVVNVWDVDSGNQVLRFPECHGRNEMTAMSLDSTGRRLVTGSRAGDIKVWQYMNSTCTKHMQKDGYSEVTGIIHILERGLFLSVGWDRRITTFKDDPDIFEVVPEDSWNGAAHSDDILCVAYSPPHYLATGSFDGTVKVWNTDLERLLVQFWSSSKAKLCTIVDGVRPPTRSWSSLRSSASRPPSRRLAKHIQSPASSSSSCHVPVDQVLFLTRRIRSRVKGNAVLVTSEAGVAKFWDVFGHKRTVGTFPMTEFKDECVIAMTTNPCEEYLLAGDTAGFIAVFNIKNYCTSAKEDMKIDPLVRWRAHSMEVVSIDYVPHETQDLVLSGAGDGTVRLWTMKGHYVGTFGQGQPWDLKSPATFQHPSTPWGEMWERYSLSKVSASSIKSASRAATPSNQRPQGGGARREVPIPEEQGEGPLHENKTMVTELKWPSGSSVSSTAITELPPSLVDRSLGEPYAELTHKRMDDRQKRRDHLSEIGIKSATENIGTVFSPFHSLELSKMEDIHIPKDMMLVLNKGKKTAFHTLRSNIQSN